MNEDGSLLVKVYFKPSYFKPSSTTADQSLAEYEEILTTIRDRLTLHDAPNVMPFRWFKETQHAGYLVRQHFHSNLLEKISTPPFLTQIEKKWFAFQLLQVVAYGWKVERVGVLSIPRSGCFPQSVGPILEWFLIACLAGAQAMPRCAHMSW